MTRGSVLIREATEADAPAITAIVREMLREDGKVTSGHKLVLDPPGSGGPDFRPVLTSPEFRTLLAVDEQSGEIAGLVVTSEDLFSSLIGRPAIHVHYLVVPGQRRHRGVGRALLTAVTHFAEELSAEQVLVDVASDAREANRFFAKTGFVLLAQRRVATVSTLRRTLGLGQPVAARETARRRIIGRF